MNNDLISREALREQFDNYKYFYSSFEKMTVAEFLTIAHELIDNAPAVSFAIGPDYVTELQNLNKELIKQLEELERSQCDLADEVWKLYEKHHSHLATHVIEFGDELEDLLGKYQKGAAE